MIHGEHSGADDEDCDDDGYHHYSHDYDED